MNVRAASRVHRPLLVGLVALAAAVLAACEPGWVNPVAGSGASGSSGDGGAAVAATLQQPGSIVYERSTGAYFVVDDLACEIRKVESSGMIASVAGDGTCGYSGDRGPATQAEIDPSDGGLGGGLAEDAQGNLYLADSGNGAIRKVTRDGTITTLASGFVDAGDVVTQLAVSTTGTLYASTRRSGVVRVAADGTQTQVLSSVSDAIAADPAGGLFSACTGICSADADGLVHVGEGSSTPTPIATLPGSSTPPVLTVDATGDVYVAVDNHVVRVGTDGAVTTIAGDGSTDPAGGAQQGAALDLALTPMGLAATRNHGLLVSSGHVVYRLDHPATAPAPPTTTVVSVVPSIVGAG